MSNYAYNATPGGLSTARGWDLAIESGCLIFRDEAGIQLAIADGAWRDVWLEEDDE